MEYKVFYNRYFYWIIFIVFFIRTFAFEKGYDVTFYELELKVIPQDQFISGINTIYFKCEKDLSILEIDLSYNMSIDSVVLFGKGKVNFDRYQDKVVFSLEHVLLKDKSYVILVYFNGKPQVAKRPPWQGGFIWDKDAYNRDWIGVACQVDGASLWWPCSEDLSDEPDSMNISCWVPNELQCISNGNLVGIKTEDAYTRYQWHVSYPINVYNVTLNIGHYSHFSNKYIGANQLDTLNMDYYILSYNIDSAKKQFQQVPEILSCLEKYFGPYPFPKDGYALVETPYVGMEHQSAIAYGNKFQNGYSGKKTNGLEFDYIILHETAHEWWGNSVTAATASEWWIQESFTTYAEALFLECKYDYRTAIDYLLEQKKNIRNAESMIQNGRQHDTDIYYKGAWMLHTLRNVINNDSLWFKIIYNLADEFKHEIVTSSEVISYFNNQSKLNLSPIFNQYLNHKNPPVFQYAMDYKKGDMILSYRWETDVEDFNMPVEINFPNKTFARIFPTQKWKKLKIKGAGFTYIELAHSLFYITEQFDAKE